jgi:hypothetical protein
MRSKDGEGGMEILIISFINKISSCVSIQKIKFSKTTEEKILFCGARMSDGLMGHKI